MKLWLSADADCWLAALVDVQTNPTWRGLAFMQTNDNHADQAIEAISRAGVIEPIEPVQFEENEPLVILRLSKKDRKSNGLSGSMADAGCGR